MVPCALGERLEEQERHQNKIQIASLSEQRMKKEKKKKWVKNEIRKTERNENPLFSLAFLNFLYLFFRYCNAAACCCWVRRTLIHTLMTAWILFTFYYCLFHCLALHKIAQWQVLSAWCWYICASSLLQRLPLAESILHLFKIKYHTRSQSQSV